MPMRFLSLFYLLIQLAFSAGAAAQELQSLPAIQKAAEGFSRDALEEFSKALGVAEPLFSPDDTAPPRRPG